MLEPASSTESFRDPKSKLVVSRQRWNIVFSFESCKIFFGIVFCTSGKGCLLIKIAHKQVFKQTQDCRPTLLNTLFLYVKSPLIVIFEISTFAQLLNLGI